MMKRTLLCAALLLSGLSAVVCVQLPASGVQAAEQPAAIYEKGEFDSFFTQDYDLTQRSYNTFTSLAGSEIAPNDNRCFISDDVLHAGNRVLKMGCDRAASGFNSFFTVFSRSLSSISSDGGTICISFDFYPQGWDDDTVIALDKKLWFQFENKEGLYFVADDQTAIAEPSAVEVKNYDSFPESELSGYRRVMFNAQLTAAEAARMNAVTFWFYNAQGKTTALLDNFSVTYEGVEVIAEGTFDNFELSVFACPSADNQNALENYGVSARSELEDYSPAMLYNDDGGNKVLRMKQGQGVFSTSNSGSLVDFTLGGAYLFPGEGTYTLSADIRLECEEYRSEGFELSFSDFSSTETDRAAALFSGGEESVLWLPDSQTLPGWKHFTYTFTVTDDEADLWNCLTLVFDTAGGSATLYLDNLTISEAGEIVPGIYHMSTQTFDRSLREDLRLNSNLGDLAVSVEYEIGGNTYTADETQYTQSAGYFTVRSAFFDAVKEDGEGTFVLKTADGKTARAALAVTGESAAPETGAASYEYGGSGDLAVDVDLKGGAIVSVVNDGIRLTRSEYTLSDDGTQLILRESFLKRLSGETNTFVIKTDGGECTFNLSVTASSAGDTTPGAGGNAALYWGLGAAGVVVVAGAAVGVFLVLRNKKRDSAGGDEVSKGDEGK